MSHTAIALGAALRSRRVSRGMSLRDVTYRTRCAVEHGTLGRIEKGKRSPTLVQLEHLAAVYGCTLEALLRPVLRPPAHDGLTAFDDALTEGRFTDAFDALGVHDG